jgi:lactoylglutathione lyase
MTAQGFCYSHTMIRVRDLDKSLDFYTRLLGMRLLKRVDHEPTQVTLALVGYGDAIAGPFLELTYEWGRKEPYELGTAFGHLALGVPHLNAACARLASEGVPITRAPGAPIPGGMAIAFIEDPNGYPIELDELPG